MSTWLTDNSSEANRPASFGGRSKTCHPVHGEACQDLLGDASDPGESIPAEVWELREGSRALTSLTAERSWPESALPEPLSSPVTSAHRDTEQDADTTSSLGLLGAPAVVSQLLTSFMYQDRGEGAAHIHPPLVLGAAWLRALS